MPETNDMLNGWLRDCHQKIVTVQDFCKTNGYGPDESQVLLENVISPFFYFGRDGPVVSSRDGGHEREVDNGLQTRQKIVSLLREMGLVDTFLDFSVNTDVLEITFKSFPDNILDYTGVIKRFGGVYDGHAKVWRIPIRG